MAYKYDDFQQIGKEQLEAATSTTACLAKSLQTIAAEATEYSKKSLESNSAFLEKLLGAKSIDSAIQIQSEYAKTSYAGFIAQATKFGELYSNLAKEAFKPIEAAISKAQGSKD